MKEVPTPELAASLALTIGDGYVHHKLALRRMTGNVPLTRRILGQHDASGWESTDVAIARLKLNLAGQPEYKQSLWRIVPIHSPIPVGT